MQTKKPVFKLIMADDHTLLREAVSRIIQEFEDFTVIAKAANGAEVINALENGSQADIVLMDLNMPVMDGYETAKWLKKNHPGIKIIILTMFDSEIALIRLLQVGVHGFLKKDIHPAELKTALTAVANGDYYYSNHTTLKITALFRKQDAVQNSFLNEEEINFLKLASSDMTYKAIAHTLQMTPRHIDSLRDALFTKLDVKSRVGLVIYAVKNGIVIY